MIRILVCSTALLFTIVPCSFAQAPAPDPDVTAEEFKILVQEIDDAQDMLLGLITGMTDAQWNFKQNPARWSVAECVEHITRTEQAIFQGIITFSSGPGDPNWFEKTKGKSELVRKLVPDRPANGVGSTFKAIREVQPTEHWDRASGIKEFYKAHGELRAFVETMKPGIKQYLFANPFPEFGDLNAYDWLNLAALHVVRHSKQIKEVQQDPKYPK